jgi:hypothetical protein
MAFPFNSVPENVSNLVVEPHTRLLYQAVMKDGFNTGGMIVGRQKLKCLEKILLQWPFGHHKPTWPTLAVNPGLHGEKLAS